MAQKFIILLLFLTLSLYAEDKIYSTQKITLSTPIIDGNLTDDVWNLVEWEGGFTQTQPVEKAEPSQQTKFKILYDDQNLYIGIICYDSSADSIYRRLSKRDNYEGDWVNVSIDSYHDLLSGFSFSVNAVGVKSDGAISNNGNSFSSNWNPIWEVKTIIATDGWYAEMKIPFSQLRFAKKENHEWGLQIERFIYRNNESSLWKFKSPKTPGWVNHFGTLNGIKNITPRKQKDITPYVVSRAKTYKKDAENPFLKGQELFGTAGVDGKIGVTNDLTLDFTINPDFGQVEADPSVMNLTTFETYQSERRPFFVEGKSIMDFAITPGWWELSRDNAFYSRRIGKRPGYCPDTEDGEYTKTPDNTTILGAIKLTGKTQKGWSIGIMESLTQQENVEIDLNGKRRFDEMEPQTNYFVGRIQKDLNKGNTRLGLIATSTNRKITSSRLEQLIHKDAYTFGIDLNHEWKEKKNYIMFNALYSQINGSNKAIYETQTNAPHYFQRSNADYLLADSSLTSLSGLSSTLRVGSNLNGKWMFSSWVTIRTPGFNNNEIGFMRTSDIIQQTNWLGYRMREVKGKFRFIGLNFNQWNGYTFGGERLYLNGNFNGHFTLTNFWSGGTGFSIRSKSVSTNELRGGPSVKVDGAYDYFIYMNTSDKKKVQLYFEVNGEKVNHNSYKRQSYHSNINVKLIEQLSLSVGGGYMLRKNKLQYVNNVDHNNTTRYIRGYMDQEEFSLTLRLNLYLTPDLSVQYYGMPFISAGKFSEFKYINDPQADNYNDRYHNFTENQVSINKEDNVFNIDEDLDGNSDYSFDNPDFNMKDFNSNLVLRWEYKAGSFLYLVWTQNRNNFANNGDFNLPQNSNDLFGAFPQNVYLIKFSYRLGL